MRSMNWTSINLVGVLLSLLVVSCSPSPPAALSEEELLEGLAGMKPRSVSSLKDKTWPLLVNKTVTYCGTIAEAEGTDADSSVTLNVEKDTCRRKPSTGLCRARATLQSWLANTKLATPSV